MTFEELQIHEQLLEAISYMNYTKATPIQEQAIPLAMQGHDILACAQTGTGKTASFVIPILNDLVTNSCEGTTSLIMVPTRELAVQIYQEIQGFSYFTDTSCKAIFGGDKGKDWEEQKKALTEGTTIIIATPGRLMAHLKFGYVKFNQLRHLVLDEADRMLDMGFYDDIAQIITYLPEDRQTLFFSATMPANIQKLADKILRFPKFIKIAISKPAAGVVQSAYIVYQTQKLPLLHHILQLNPEYDSIIIFTSTKKNVMNIVRSLASNKLGYTVEGMSSDLEQTEREGVLMRYKAKKTQILVATDVMSRGIDIKGINLVVNFDVPDDAVDYVHRVGRTARADSKGEAITLVSEEDMYNFSRIQTLIETDVPKLLVPKELGKTPVWEPNAKKPNPRAKHASAGTNENKNKKKSFRHKHHSQKKNDAALPKNSSPQ